MVPCCQTVKTLLPHTDCRFAAIRSGLVRQVSLPSAAAGLPGIRIISAAAFDIKVSRDPSPFGGGGVEACGPSARTQGKPSCGVSRLCKAPAQVGCSDAK